jgi:hypothetical protein
MKQDPTDNANALFLLEAVRDALMPMLVSGGLEFDIEDAIFDLKEDIKKDEDAEYFERNPDNGPNLDFNQPYM